MAAAAGAPPAFAATGPEYFGTNLQTLGAVTPAARAGVLAALGREGLTLGRVEVRWDTAEPAPPSGGAHTYAWGGVDAQVRAFAAVGIRVAPLFRHTPWWVRRSDPSKPGGVDEFPPARYSDFAAMVAAFAARYGDGGTFWRANPDLPALPTRTYEIWNEVNLAEYAWNADPNPEAYSELLKVVRPALKASQPGAVLIGALAYQESEAPDYVPRMGRAGGLAALDGMGYHPYAPEAVQTIALVRHLRAQLAAAGAPGLPIYANEAGQEAVVTNPDGSTVPNRAPAEWGWQQFPSDASRAANLAFAGEALAVSDCGVEQFLPYSVSDSEREGEKLTEAYMGLFRPATGAATLTAEALYRAAGRWRARFAGGGGVPARLALCGAGAEPHRALLPIQTTYTGTQPGCVRVRAQYDGNPLEAATLTVSDRSGRGAATQQTNAFGEASACIAGGVAEDFRATLVMGGAGQGGSVACDVRGIGCPAGTSIAPAPGTWQSAAAVTGLPPATMPTPAPTPQAERAPACTWSSTTKQVRFVARKGRRAAKATLSTTLTCKTARKGEAFRFAVYVRTSRQKKSRRLKTVTLRNRVAKRFFVRGSFKSGRRIYVTYRQVPKADIPRLQDRLTLRLRARTS